MRVRQSMAVVACIVVLPACTAGPAQDDTEVEGVQVERDDVSLGPPSDAPTAEAEAPEQGDDLEDLATPRPRITRRPVVPTPLPAPSDQAVRAGGAATGGGAPGPPSPPAPAPAEAEPGAAPATGPDTGSTDTSSTVVERPAPTDPPAEALASGQGWGYVSLLPHEDGSGWTETSAAPPQDRSGDSGYRVFTTVATSAVDGAPAQLDVGCPSWVAAAPEVGLRGEGTVIVELRAGDRILASAIHAVAVELGPSERDPDLPWGSFVRVDAADGAAVTCTVRIDA
jgi:hypothetical protein